MKKLLLCCILILVFNTQASAAEFTAPVVPVQAEKYFPESQESFANDLWYIFKSVIADIYPDFTDATKICLRVVAVILLGTFLNGSNGGYKRTVSLIQVVTISVILLGPSRAMLALGVDTVTELLEYSKLLAPVLTGTLAAQGGMTASTALYIGTTIFNTVMGSFINGLLVPLVYGYIAISVADNAIGEDALKRIKSFIKWLMTWSLKIIIYVFTGYMSITGVVSSSADATAIKAAKLTIAGVVPIVGNIISDASDAVLGSAAVIKNSVGIYGLLAVAAIWMAPFIRVGAHYLLLKLTTAVCAVFDQNASTKLTDDYCTVLGCVMAMISLTSLLTLISTVCFMKGIS
ncbi:MAG: hypothetical protein IKU07_08660 [Oscillospiraceae bacterium]|nr:hypothetical protein [Oscillospiraceae bacterium]